MPQQSPPRKRRGRLFRFGAAVAVLLAVAGYLTVQYLTGSMTPRCTVVSGTGDGASYDFTPEQAVNAATISAVGTTRGMSERAVTIALATALQESDLRNIEHGDRDSLGLFQQRPSQGWGTREQIMDPTYAAKMFYEHLAKVPDYGELPLTLAAQRVQHSGYPEAYAKQEPDAALLAAALTGNSPATLTCQGRIDATTTRAAGPDAVRAALVRDFGRDALQPAGAEVSTQSAPAPSPTPGTRTSGRTVTVPVTAGKGAAKGRSAVQRGWQLAHWAVANSTALHIDRVSYGGRVWTAGNTESQWRATGTQGTSGAEKDADAVRMVTGQ